MNRMKLFVAAFMLTATALIPKGAPAFAFCSFQQCYHGLLCPPSDCPAGYSNIPQCSAPYCQGFCECIPNP